jgi:HK97 family phage portal protein
MAIIQSFGSLQAITDTRNTISAQVNQPAWQQYGYSNQYAIIYASQPSIRTCVDFLARNIAQLGFFVYRRVSDTDRLRLVDHELAQWLAKPNPFTTQYRLFESLVADLALYFNAYWLKIRLPDRIGLVRLPPPTMRVEGALLPTQFIWTVGAQNIPIDPSEIVYFNGYNALNALMGLSPIETLARIIAEDIASGQHREQFWRNASRIEGIIERPKDAPKWTPAQKQSWREQWQLRHSGPMSAGMIAVLEDGMSFKPTAFSARDSEYLNARKLSREEVAAQYHIPLPMVGILDHATFSNIKEQHKQLYTDCLGPWNEMIQQTIEAQLLPECKDTDKVYAEFNIAEKLKGSFEEQANALRVLVGRPVMTANEGRARLNLPSIKDDPTADQLALQAGGPSPSATAGGNIGDVVEGHDAGLVQRAAAVTSVVRTSWLRQAARLAKVPAADRASAFDQARAATELTTDLMPVVGSWDRAARYAHQVTQDTYARLLAGTDAFDAREVPPCDAPV